jgi:hypothetical protein
LESNDNEYIATTYTDNAFDCIQTIKEVETFTMLSVDENDETVYRNMKYVDSDIVIDTTVENPLENNILVNVWVEDYV